jgi:hypothetical protein
MARESWDELHAAVMTSGLFIAPVWALLHTLRFAHRAILRRFRGGALKR